MSGFPGEKNVQTCGFGLEHSYRSLTCILASVLSTVIAARSRWPLSHVDLSQLHTDIGLRLGAACVISGMIRPPISLDHTAHPLTLTPPPTRASCPGLWAMRSLSYSCAPSKSSIEYGIPMLCSIYSTVQRLSQSRSIIMTIRRSQKRCAAVERWN